MLRELGRAEAALASKTRTPILPSNHFISQYLESFAEDPIYKIVNKVTFYLVAQLLLLLFLLLYWLYISVLIYRYEIQL